MKLIDIANRIDKSKENEDYIDITDLSDELDYEFDYVKQDLLKAYWIGNWYCTDSYVGYKMYFLDDVPVAISTQQGRKSDEYFEWFSRELALKVKEYLISLMPESDLSLQLCDINRDVGVGYTIEFNAQILAGSSATLNGESVEILERVREEPDYGIDKMLKVLLQSGEEKNIDISELEFKYHLIGK